MHISTKEVKKEIAWQAFTGDVADALFEQQRAAVRREQDRLAELRGRCSECGWWVDQHVRSCSRAAKHA